MRKYIERIGDAVNKLCGIRFAGEQKTDNAIVRHAKELAQLQDKVRDIDLDGLTGGSRPHVSLGRGEQGEFLIYVDGHLRGKYATAEMMQAHFAECIIDCDRLRANQRPLSASQLSERYGIEASLHDPVEGLLGS